MSSLLQTLVDELAIELGEAVTVDDERWRLVAYSALAGEGDRVRQRSILERRTPPDATAWARELGLAAATEPIRVPANPVVGAVARVAIPLRHEGRLLGFMTVVDPHGALTDDALGAISRAAERAAQALAHDRLVEGLARARERELLRDLVADDVALRHAAAAALREDGLLRAGASRAVAVLRGSERAGALAEGIERYRRRVLPGTVLGLTRGDDAVILVTGDDDAAVRRTVGALRATVAEVVQHELVAGCSGPLDELVAAPSALRQATRAASVAARIPRFAGLAAWDDLGVYGILSELGGGAAAERSEHPALARLRAADRRGALVTTLEVYLDRAGDAQATAEALSLHRAGLYYRLSRISEITGLDLRDGEARLLLHLSLKLERLTDVSEA